MNSPEDLEKRLKALPLRGLDPSRKNAILRKALPAPTRRWSIGLIGLPLLEWMRPLHRRAVFGGLASIWLATLYFHVSAPSEKSLQIAQFAHPVHISAQEMIAALYMRNRIVEHWGEFEPYPRPVEVNIEGVPRYPL